jgi:hypothetical protein
MADPEAHHYHTNKMMYHKLTHKKESDNETEREIADILYHGTSMFYINDIIIDGINGIYPEELYVKIKEYWSFIRNNVDDPRKGYVDWFLERQKEVRETGWIDIDFTGDKSVGEEYAGRARVIGEGPTVFSHMLSKYIKLPGSKSNPNYDEMVEFAEQLEHGLRYPGILLAIKVDENEEELTENINVLPVKGTWSHGIHFTVSPERLYIVTEGEPSLLPSEPIEDILIPLISDEGNEYITEKMDVFEEGKRQHDEYLASHGEEWKSNSHLTGVRKYYTLRTEDYASGITATLDNLKDREHFSIHIIISENGYQKHVNNIIFFMNGEISDRSQTSIELLRSDNNAKEKIHEVISQVLPLVEDDGWKYQIIGWLEENIDLNYEE